MFRKTIAVAALACCPAAALAANDALSSSYLEGAYLSSEVDAGTPTTDEVEGFRAAFSLGLLPYLNLRADFDQHRFQDSRDGFGSVGLVGHTLDPTWQAFGGVSYERLEIDDNKTSAGDSLEEGYGVLGGVRIVGPSTEFHASYKYFALSQPAPDTDLKGSKYGAGITVDLFAWWSLVGDYGVRTLEISDPTTSNDVEYSEWSVGLRRYFATQTDASPRRGGLIGDLFPDD